MTTNSPAASAPPARKTFLNLRFDLKTTSKQFNRSEKAGDDEPKINDDQLGVPTIRGHKAFLSDIVFSGESR